MLPVELIIEARFQLAHTPRFKHFTRTEARAAEFILFYYASLITGIAPAFSSPPRHHKAPHLKAQQLSPPQLITRNLLLRHDAEGASICHHATAADEQALAMLPP